jgi:hypothetical protein
MKMEKKSELVIDSIESAMNLFEGYEMLNHLSSREKQIVISTLKQIAIAGYSEAKSLLLNSSLKF